MRYAICCFMGLMLALPLAAQVEVKDLGDRVAIQVEGKPFTEFVMKGEGVSKPYYYPIHSSSGKVITRHYPMKEGVEGESSDHPHHRGMWFAHGDVNGVDFWAADPSREGDKYGKIVFRKVSDLRSGKGEGSFTSVFDWVDSEGSVILTEERRTTVYSVRLPLRIMDVDVLLIAGKETHFGDTKEGTFAIRVADSMNERHTGTLLNAQGATGEKQVWGKPSPFMDYHGEVGGEHLGVAIFDAPGNPRHPTHWHVRSYGLFAANIFGEHDFYPDESRDGGMTLRPGDAIRFVYRVLIHTGDPESANIDRHYANWAKGKYLQAFKKVGRCLTAEEREKRD